MNCKDSMKRADLELDNTAAAMVEEARIRENGFIYFAFENCQDLKNHEKRFVPIAIKYDAIADIDEYKPE